MRTFCTLGRNTPCLGHARAPLGHGWDTGRATGRGSAPACADPACAEGISGAHRVAAACGIAAYNGLVGIMGSPAAPNPPRPTALSPFKPCIGSGERSETDKLCRRRNQQKGDIIVLREASHRHRRTPAKTPHTGRDPAGTPSGTPHTGRGTTGGQRRHTSRGTGRGHNGATAKTPAGTPAGTPHTGRDTTRGHQRRDTSRAPARVTAGPQPGHRP